MGKGRGDWVRGGHEGGQGGRGQKVDRAEEGEEDKDGYVSEKGNVRRKMDIPILESQTSLPPKPPPKSLSIPSPLHLSPDLS